MRETRRTDKENDAPQPHRRVEEMETDTPICVLHLKVERSENVEMVERGALSVKSERFTGVEGEINKLLKEEDIDKDGINVKDIKQEEEVEMIDIKCDTFTDNGDVKQELSKVFIRTDASMDDGDIKQEESGTPDDIDSNEIEGETDVDDTIEDLMQLSDSDGDDLELDTVCNDACPLPTLACRDARAEPSCAADLTAFQAQVLEVEDRCNDTVIRDIAADDNCTFDWKEDVTTFTGQRETFTGTPGPTAPVTEQTAVRDVFYRMFDGEFIDNICTETNRYAEQKIAALRRRGKLTTTSRLHRWTPTNRDEIISYLAILILQGLYPRAEEESYFSFNGFGTMPYFNKIMSYNRFILLKSRLRFVDNETLAGNTDKLFKIKPVIDYLNNKFSSLYMPSQEISIDESLLKRHGRLSFAQKIATKASQVGVKTYELCDSSNGYLWKFFVCAGKCAGGRPESDGEDANDRPNYSLTNTNIVHDLVKPLLNRGHTVIMDNFFNTPLLLRCLKRQKTDGYGTIRLNREFAPESMKTLTKTDLRPGEVVATYCEDLSMMVWRDANLVSMISTYHRVQIGTRQKYNRVANKPQIVLDYNKSLGGADRKDRFLSAQPVDTTRNREWHKKVFQRLFSTAIFNCFIIFGTRNPNMSHRQFRTILAESLLLQHRQINLASELRLTYKTGSGQITTTPRPARTRPTVAGDHFPVRTGKSRFRCVMCARRKVEARTVWKCMECNVHLCIDVCFRSYHKQ